MAIQPSDLGEAFVKSGRRLITQRSADELLGRANIKPITPKILFELDLNQDWCFYDSTERHWVCVRQLKSFIRWDAWMLSHYIILMDSWKRKNIKLDIPTLRRQGKQFNDKAILVNFWKVQMNNLSTKSTNIIKPTLSNANTPQNARVNIDQPLLWDLIHRWTQTSN